MPLPYMQPNRYDHADNSAEVWEENLQTAQSSVKFYTEVLVPGKQWQEYMHLYFVEDPQFWYTQYYKASYWFSD